MDFINRECPICKKTLTPVKNKYTREFVGCGPQVAKCSCCGLTCLNPVMSDAEYNEFYNKDGQKGFVERLPNVSDSYDQKISSNDARRISLFHKVVKRGKRVLDIGTGNSNFIGMVDNATGIDINKGRVDDSVSRGLDVRHCNIYDWNESVDVVTVFHILEHITDPICFLHKIHGLLNENGILIVEVPNLDDVLVNLPSYGEFYYQNAHCTYFTPETLKLLVRRCGFDVADEISLQRYSLNNHLHWLIKGCPGKFKEFNLLNRIYSWALKVLRKHDTIFLVCVK